MAKNEKQSSAGRTSDHPDKKKPRSGRSSGPISFFLALIVMALGLIQLAATFHSYAVSLSELNGLKNQEAHLIAQKQDLENQIQRWDDKAYVTAQARDRLGFIFPGEQAIRVLHPEAVTGQEDQNAKKNKGVQAPRQNTLPWYQEMAYSFKKADQRPQVSGHSQTASPSTSPSPGGTDTSGQNQEGQSSQDDQPGGGSEEANPTNDQ